MRRLLLIACLGWAALAPTYSAAEPVPTPVKEEMQVDDPFAEEDLDGIPEEIIDDEEFAIVADPLEKVNRGVFWFNDKLYFYVLKPIARVYRRVPESVRVSVANFFDNLGAPVRAFNAAAQAKFARAGDETARFFINSTVGILGLFDPAERYAAIKRTDEDFGQTLGVYGAGPGFYIVLPFLGPSSLRDGVGSIVDTEISPLYAYHEREDKENQYVWLVATDAVNTVSLDKDTYESIKRDALDPYQFVRDAFIQNREGKIKK